MQRGVNRRQSSTWLNMEHGKANRRHKQPKTHKPRKFKGKTISTLQKKKKKRNAPVKCTEHSVGETGSLPVQATHTQDLVCDSILFQSRLAQHPCRNNSKATLWETSWKAAPLRTCPGDSKCSTPRPPPNPAGTPKDAMNAAGKRPQGVPGTIRDMAQ